ncbi:hypothetical protein MUK42_18122 [Musa troglodytarum]|uniref:Uncharacterized protein n=1 Tax=Musa troglodytarum TaxID=320322 RepID=A0A9E7H541_9LILI|nr:hypothetical protein MUK42_18122 [Musa troglodytarum]
MTAQRIWVLCMATRRLSRVSWWYSWVPWEKLKRATFIPARSSFSSIGTDRDAGPSVHTIFVLGTRPSLGSSLSNPSMSMFAIPSLLPSGNDNPSCLQQINHNTTKKKQR